MKTRWSSREKIRLRLADRFEVGDAHGIWSASSRVETAHQSSSLPTGASSCCAVATASSTSAAISARICCKRFAIQKFLFEDQLLGALQRILRERLAPNVVGHVAGVVVLAVTGETQSRCDDELRWTTGARALDGGADDFEALRQVGAVDRAAFVAVALRAIDQIRTGELAVVRRGVGVMIVCRDDDQRHMLDRGDVHPFVRRAGLHAAFADGR